MTDYLNADEAAEFLGIKRPTLYAYVSRGLLESAAAPEDGRQKRYRKADLERLKRRSAASSGHDAAAAEALNWGPPSLRTGIAALTPMGPKYRGHRLRDVLEAERDEPWQFEEVAELLWDDVARESRSEWPAPEPDDTVARPDRHPHPVDALITAVQRTRLTDARRHVRDSRAERQTARRLVSRVLTQSCQLLGAGSRIDSAESVATRVARLAGAPMEPRAVRLVEATLITAAEHGLNASTFAGRVAASTGADLYACVLAALSAFSGPRHGLHSERVMALLDGIATPEQARSHLESRLQRGEALPGFGHPLYEMGDPRFDLLHERARAYAPDNERLAVLDAVCEAGEELGLSAPNLDFGFCSVLCALELPPEAGPLIFACGRMAGWIAHALEQRQQDHLLRPRSEYETG